MREILLPVPRVHPQAAPVRFGGGHSPGGAPRVPSPSLIPQRVQSDGCPTYPFPFSTPSPRSIAAYAACYRACSTNEDTKHDPPLPAEYGAFKAPVLEAGWAPMRAEALAKAAKEESSGGEKLGLSVNSELSSGPG